MKDFQSKKLNYHDIFLHDEIYLNIKIQDLNIINAMT